MIVLLACDFTALGILIGAWITERMWWLVCRPLPRPWRAVRRAYARLWRDAWRLLETGRLT